MTTVQKTLRAALIYGAIASVVIAVLGSIIGGMVAGTPGVVSALIGAGVGFLFVGVTALSVLLAASLTRDDPGNPLFFGVIMGAWLIKFVAFLASVLLLRDQSFIDPIVLFVCLVASAILSVTGDVVAALRSRVPYVAAPIAPTPLAAEPASDA